MKALLLALALALFAACKTHHTDACEYCIQKSCSTSIKLDHTALERIISHFNEVVRYRDCVASGDTKRCELPSGVTLPDDRATLTCFVDALGGTCSKACGIR